MVVLAGMITIGLGLGLGIGQGVVSTWWGIQNESQYRTIQSQVENYVGRVYMVYHGAIYTVFNVILFSNMQGMVPYGTTGTVEIVQTQSISFTQQIGIQQIGVMRHGEQQQGGFIPGGTPQGQVPQMIVQEIVAYQTKIQGQS